MGNFEAWHHNLQKRTKMVATCNWLHCFHYLIQIFVVHSCSLIANCFCNYVASNYSRSSRHLWYSLIIAQVLPQIWIACCLRWRWQWASCQIRTIAGAHAPGMPGTFSPSPQVGDPGMHHGTCVTHVPWCMPGSLTSSFLWNRRRAKPFPAFPAHAQPAILRIW